MISKVSGKIILMNEDSVVMDTGNIGYKIHLSDADLSLLEIGGEASFWTYLIVRENAQDLYGFSNPEEKTFFELLIGVSGIGPKSAMAILNMASINILKRAIATNDDTYLTKVSGIGKKTAQKILLELKDKLDLSSDGEYSLKEEADTIEALKALGYSLKEARDALKNVSEDITNPNERIREALRNISNG